jgi:hypothetical protein
MKVWRGLGASPGRLNSMNNGVQGMKNWRSGQPVLERTLSFRLSTPHSSRALAQTASSISTSKSPTLAHDQVRVQLEQLYGVERLTLSVV